MQVQQPEDRRKNVSRAVTSTKSRLCRSRMVFSGVLRTSGTYTPNALAPHPFRWLARLHGHEPDKGMFKGTVFVHLTRKRVKSHESAKSRRSRPNSAATCAAGKDRERGPMRSKSRSASPALASSFSLNGSPRGPRAKTLVLGSH